jgi:hypothetical protein
VGYVFNKWSNQDVHLVFKSKLKLGHKQIHRMGLETDDNSRWKDLLDFIAKNPPVVVQNKTGASGI